MKPLHRFGPVLIAIAFLGAVVYLLLFHQPGAEEEEAPTAGAVVKVKVVPLTRERIEQTITAFGLVVPAADQVQTVSAPFECRVRREMVMLGQSVSIGAALIEIEPSPATRLELDQARRELATTQEELKLTEQRLELKLATQMELVEARQKAEAAALLVRSLQQRKVGPPHIIAADAAGVVSKLEVKEGQIVAAGDALLELAGEQHWDVKLGVEVEDQDDLKVGQSVRLYPTNDPDEKAIDGRIRLITRQVNPETRLVDVLVEPASSAGLLLGEFMRGVFTIASPEGLVAPREAVLPEEDHYVLYTVEDGHAVKHTVNIVVENGRQAQVTGEGLAEGQPAVVVGQSELQDGMSVDAGPEK
jgi:membrane fusion protein, multidrug efflux system